MFVPDSPQTDPHYLDHDLYRGEDGQGNEYLLTVFHDGTRTLATRALGERTWGAPVLLRGVL